MPSQFAKHKIDDHVIRLQPPYVIGVVVFVFHKRGEEGPQQVVVNSLAHDKLQVGWASEFRPYDLANP